MILVSLNSPLFFLNKHFNFLCQFHFRFTSPSKTMSFIFLYFFWKNFPHQFSPYIQKSILEYFCLLLSSHSFICLVFLISSFLFNTLAPRVLLNHFIFNCNNSTLLSLMLSTHDSELCTGDKARISLRILFWMLHWLDIFYTGNLPSPSLHSIFSLPQLK